MLTFVMLLPETNRLKQLCKELGDKSWQVLRGPVPCICFQGEKGYEITKGNHVRWVRESQIINETAFSDDMESSL